MASIDFVHLHLHTEYSLLDGAISLKRLFPRLKEFGMNACAVTDHGNMYGVVRFYKEAKAAGIKPIIGVEAYMTQGSRTEKVRVVDGIKTSHLVLLAKNETGYRNLCRLISLANLEGFYYDPRIDRELLEKYADGLIGMSACLSGHIPQLIAQDRMDEAVEAADWYRGVFGDGNFFLELQENGLDRQRKVNEGLIEIAKKTGLPLVATNDSHYLKEKEAYAHEVLLCIGTQKTMLDSDESRLKFHATGLYVKSGQEMEAAFAHVPEALANTRRIADMCDITFTFDEFKYPRFEVKKGTTFDETLYAMAVEGLHRRLDEDYPDDSPEKRAVRENRWMRRLDSEMDLIRTKGFAGYFLIVHDVINHSREIGVPVGPGRGSAAGSLLSYSIGITDINPIRYGLLFERFLNPERQDNPDIDIDFCAEGRQKLIEYVTQKYGADYVAQISTFGSMKAKAVVRDVGRALGKTFGEVDQIARLIPGDLGMTLEKAKQQEPRLLEAINSEEWVAKLMDVAESLEGLNRHASTHAAGIVIGDQPLIETLPIYRGAEGEIVTQFDKKDVESVGLIKFDFLGLKTLTVIDKALAEIQRTAGDSIDLRKIPMDDPETFTLFQKGETTGVFQFESAGMKEWLIKLRPTAFEDLIVMAALYRPGPLGSGMVQDFVDRRHGRQKVVYDLPILADILKETYGTMVYQEQVMEVARAVGGFSLGESDLLRRAMAKKNVSKMAAYEKKFIEGAEAQQIDPSRAQAIFDKMAKFAEYGFNKSHSAAYALVAYHTAYLKAHYPAQFMAALMSMETHDSDRLMGKLHECREMGIGIDPPDINRSMRDFSVAEGRIVFGLSAIKGVGEGAIEQILAARTEAKAFASMYELCEAVDLRQVNKRVLEALAKAGAFDRLGGHRAQHLAVVEPAMERASQIQRDRASGQSNMFDTFRESNPKAAVSARLPDLPEFDHRTFLENEKQVLGFYLTGHPLEDHRDVLTLMSADIESIRRLDNRREVTLAAVVTQFKAKATRKGGTMAFVQLEDLRGSTEMIVFPDVLEGAREILEGDRPIAVKGQTDVSEKGVKIIADEIVLLKDVRDAWSREVVFRVQADGVESGHLARLKEIVARYPGRCKGTIDVLVPSGGKSSSTWANRGEFGRLRKWWRK